MSTLRCELCGIVSALQTFERYIIGSLFPIYLYYDHKPILYLWRQRRKICHRLLKYQPIITEFHNLKSSGHLDLISRFPRFSPETWHPQRQVVYNFGIRRFHRLHPSMIRTVTKCTTPSSMKMNRTHLITTSTASPANNVTQERISDLRTMEMSIM